MRHNRIKTRKNNKNTYLKFIGIIIILAVLSISIGFFGTKYYLYPRLFANQDNITDNSAAKNNTEKQPQENADSKASNTDKKEATIDNSSEKSTEEKLYTFEIPPLSIYNVQVGSFNERKYAQSHIKGVNDKGLAGYIVDSERYRVIVMSFVKRNSADQFKNNIKEHYSDAFISPRQLPTREINYGDSGKAYSEVASKEIMGLKKYYENYSNFLSSKDVASVSSDEILKFVDGEINRLDGIIKTMATVSPSDDFNSFNSKFTSIVENSKTKLIEIKQSNFSDRTKLFEVIMEGLNSYEAII